MYTKYTQKCIPHFDKNFCILFVNKIYTKFCRNVGYILYTDIFYSLHFVYINSDLQKMYIIKIMYTICIQNSCRMFIQINVCKMEQIQVLMRIWKKMPNLCSQLSNIWVWLKWTFGLKELASYFSEGLGFFIFFCAWSI